MFFLFDKAVSAKLYDGSQMDELKKDLTFPQEEDLANYSSSAFIPAQISIPPGFLQERLSQQNGNRYIYALTGPLQIFPLSPRNIS